MDKVYSLPQLKDALFPLFLDYDIRKAVLFGSYGKGTATGKSYVDLLLDSSFRCLRFIWFLD